MNPDYITYLTEALKQPLPGRSAHRRLVPPGRKLEPCAADVPRLKYSSVLLLLFPVDGRIYTCLIKRPSSMKHHPGQVSLPGGAVENSDSSPEMTAIREAREEVGIDPQEIQVIGKLSDLYIPVSRFVIHPYLAWSHECPHFQPNAREVEKLILFPVFDFATSETLCEEELDTVTGRLKVPCYPFAGEIIWGATAMILSELFEVLKKSPFIPASYSYNGEK